MKITERVKHTAGALRSIYTESFGGKEWGRYRIRRSELKEISGLKRLSPGFLRRLSDACFESGHALVDRDDDFVFIDHDRFDNYRKVPKAMASQYGFEEELDEQDDDADGDGSEDEGSDEQTYADEDIERLTELLRAHAKQGKTTPYTPVAQPFGLDMSNPDHRNIFAGMLAQVSIAEHEGGRGMLSAVVIRPDRHKPGHGFFDLAEQLGLFDSAKDDEEECWIKELNKVYAANKPKSSRRAARG